MSEPKWGGRLEPISFNGSSRYFLEELQKIIDFPDSFLPGLKEYLDHVFVHYLIRKKSYSRHESCCQSSGPLKAAASSILADVNKLLKKLDGNAGGLDVHFDMYMEKIKIDAIKDANREEIYAAYGTEYTKGITNLVGDINGSSRDILEQQCLPLPFENLESELIKLKEFCEAAPNVIEDSERLLLTRVTPKRELVWFIARLFRKHFKVSPSIYLPEGGEAGSPYARFLSLCFTEIDGFAPGDLKKLMIWEKKEWGKSEKGTK